MNTSYYPKIRRLMELGASQSDAQAIIDLEFAQNHALELVARLVEILNCCELNQDDMEPETRDAIEKCLLTLKKARGVL